MMTNERKALMSQVVKGYKLKKVPQGEMRDRSIFRPNLYKLGGTRYLNLKQNQQNLQNNNISNTNFNVNDPAYKASRLPLLKEVEKGYKLNKVKQADMRDYSAPNFKYNKLGQQTMFGRKNNQTLDLKTQMARLLNDINKSKWKLNKVKSNMMRDRSAPYFRDYLQSGHKIGGVNMQQAKIGMMPSSQLQNNFPTQAPLTSNINNEPAFSGATVGEKLKNAAHSFTNWIKEEAAEVKEGVKNIGPVNNETLKPSSRSNASSTQ